MTSSALQRRIPAALPPGRQTLVEPPVAPRRTLGLAGWAVAAVIVFILGGGLLASLGTI